MLFQPSNISPSTLSGIGAGTVDVTQGLTVSWQVNGDTPMTDYQITIYQNDTASTQKYTTGKISLSTPFQTHDKNGNPQFFSTQISAANLSAAGIVNGYANGYKILIKQWWGSGANDYVTQTSAAVFNTLANPTLTINTISGTNISETITANYSQAQGDPISTVEWIFTVAGNESSPIKQTGTVTTQILEFDVDGLMDGTTYSVECNVVTAGGVYISTGFIQFTVSYSITQEQINTTLGKINGSNGVYLSWSPMSSNSINWYDVYRMEVGSYFLKKVATVASNLREVVDYSAGSNQTVQYIIIGLNGTTPVSSAQTSPVTPIFWDYSILLCHTDNDGVYHVDSEYRFGLNVETGNISNNNEPTFQINFTKYPNRQPISTLYKTGTLKSYIGKAGGQGQYTDSLALQDAIFRVSTSTLKKFLKTRKGDVLMVETSSSIDMKTLDGSPLQPMYATINWAEVGDASNISIVSEPSDEFFPIVTSYEYSDPITASIVRFNSDNGGLPFKEVIVSMAPIQDLHGYNAPWPAGGGVSKCPSFANGTHTMTNGLTVTIQDGEITIDGTASSAGYYEEDIESTVMPADAYVSFNNPVGTFNIAYVFIHGSTQIAAPSLSPANGTKQPTGLSGATVNKLRIFCNAATYDNFKMSPIVHDGSTPQAWQPYANICPISGRSGLNVFVSPTEDIADATAYAEDWTLQAGTVYGGTVDIISGVLTVDRANIPSYNGETITEPWLSSMDEYTPGATPTTGAQVVYKLDTPLTYQLTPQEVDTLMGANNVWSDSGDVTVIYAVSEKKTVKAQ